MFSVARSRIDGGIAKGERLGCLEVQDHLKFCRELNGKLRRLSAAQNAIDIEAARRKVST
jgi:hypothetical protein